MNRLFRILTVCALLISVTGCAKVGTIKKLANYKVYLDNPAETVPVRIVNGAVILPVKFNDEGKTYNFLLDTGGLNAISPKLAMKQGVQPAFHVISPVVSGEIKDHPVGIVDKIKVGKGISATNVPFGIYDLTILKERTGIPIDGLIGNNFLMNFEFTVDYYHKNVIFQKPYNTNISETRIEPGVWMLPLKFSVKEGLVPKITGKVNGTVKAFFAVDTGNLGLTFIEHDTAAYLGYLDDPKLQMAELDGEPIGGYTGLYVQPIIGKLDSILFGTMETGPQLFISAQAESNLLGYYILKNYRITMNYDKGVVVFRKHQKPVPPKVRSTCWLAIGYKDGRYVITGLVKGSSAQQAGLAAFDEVLEVNGTKSAELGLEKIQDILLDDSVETVSLTIKGKENPVELKKMDLLNLKACLIKDPDEDD